jgi:hypothetical protein
MKHVHGEYIAYMQSLSEWSSIVETFPVRFKTK